MSARDAGPAPADVSLEDQARACLNDITWFMATRAARPIQTDTLTAFRDTNAALIEAEQIMMRAALLLGSAVTRA